MTNNLHPEIGDSNESDPLLVLIHEIETIARTARFTMTASPGMREHLRRKLQAMRLASVGVRAEDGAPYRDARMVLTESILHCGSLERSGRRSSLDRRAQTAASRIASLYPTLAAEIEKPGRVALIRTAMSTAARRTRYPWKQIVAAWAGIEPTERSENTWRSDWTRYCEERGLQPNWLG